MSSQISRRSRPVWLQRHRVRAPASVLCRLFVSRRRGFGGMPNPLCCLSWCCSTTRRACCEPGRGTGNSTGTGVAPRGSCCGAPKAARTARSQRSWRSNGRQRRNGGHGSCPTGWTDCLASRVPAAAHDHRRPDRGSDHRDAGVGPRQRHALVYPVSGVFSAPGLMETIKPG